MLNVDWSRLTLEQKDKLKLILIAWNEKYEIEDAVKNTALESQSKAY